MSTNSCYISKQLWLVRSKWWKINKSGRVLSRFRRSCNHCKCNCNYLRETVGRGVSHELTCAINNRSHVKYVHDNCVFDGTSVSWSDYVRSCCDISLNFMHYNATCNLWEIETLEGFWNPFLFIFKWYLMAVVVRHI